MSVRLAIVGFLALAACRPPEAAEAVHPGSHQRLRAGPAWDDPARCDEAVAAGSRLPRPKFRVRVGTWNVKAFPKYSDVGWLACALTWLDVDLVGLQEVLLTADGKEALDELTRQLAARTGAAWYWVADTCPDPERFHMVLLHRGDRVHLSDVATHPEVDPTHKKEGGTTECPGNLRPALGAYVQSNLGGVDFHFVTTQLDAGERAYDFGNRQRAWLGIGDVQLARAALRADDDFVVAADFNSTGCAQRGIADREEIGIVREVFDALEPPLVLADATEGCTYFTEGGTRHVDHIAVSAAMKEARGSAARVSGLCVASRCRPTDRGHALALSRLSDHCPVVFDIIDTDED
jgi:endonuclease/exonuclease/phosphatase family metal-dependent hydrolase